MAKSIGDSEAAEIYQRLVREVFLQVRVGNPDVISVFYTPADKATEIEQWLSPWISDFSGEIEFHPQSDGDLGDRLENATEVMFQNHPSAGVLIIGTDCIELDPGLLQDAWERLEIDDAPVVIGPSTDGGYYLIGTSEPIPELYRDIPWSTEQTLSATIGKAAQFNKECFLLPEKTDIDTINEYQLFEDRLKDRPCVFFDRDGVVNESPGPGYVLNTKDFHLSNGIKESLQAARAKGYLTVVVTSQKGVGKELMSMGGLSEIHHNLQTDLAKQGVAFDGIYFYTGAKDCLHQAKPHPAMITAAQKDFGIDLKRSWMVGDADRDIEMGQNAELLGTIRIKGDKPILTEADHTINSVVELPKLLRKLL